MVLQDPLEALEAAKSRPGVPYYSDFTVLATLLPGRSTDKKLTLALRTEDGRGLEIAWVFPAEWYPDARPEDEVRFSHYFPALRQVYSGLDERGQELTVRLQVLKFVYSRHHVVLLKFVIGPEYSLAAGQLQNCYDCPLRAFFVAFVGINRDVTRRPTDPKHVAGKAIHSGYARAALTTWRGEPYPARVEAYWRGVTDVWTDNFAYLASDNVSKQLKDYHHQPAKVIDRVLERCSAKVRGALELLQERDLFSATRGMAGKVDRIIRDSDGWHLYEIKTSSGPTAFTDPRTGDRVPGGIQGLAYVEILRTQSGDPVLASVEEFKGDGFREVALRDHPMLLRAKAKFEPQDDNYIDLWAQIRNVAYMVTTGLATGYDRRRIAGLASRGFRLRGLGGRFDLYAPWPPCNICPAHQRGVCDADRKKDSATWPNFWLNIPQRLWEYWAWFHYQLKQEEAVERTRLFKIASTDPNRLEGQEGTCITGLSLAGRHGRRVILERNRPIVTRIRADDRVLVTPLDAVPGGLYSLRGVVEKVDQRRICIHLWEEMDQAEPATFRVDQLGRYELVDWGIKGVTDFLLGAMMGSGKFGRTVSPQELPPMARYLLAVDIPPPLEFAEPDPAWLSDLNEGQALAVRAALALRPGEFLLIQGPPGTGKTQTIARMAHLLVLRELWDRSPTRPVLILAYTNRACDEIVRKLKEIPELAPFVIRVGDARADTDLAAKDRILSELVRARDRMDQVLRDPTDLSPLRRAILQARLHWDQALVFVGTLASAERPELAGLTFSTVIVDEAGQATEPHTLQALRHMPQGFSAALVLVGDHHQLPPVVQDDTSAPPLHPELSDLRLSQEKGLQMSLFERLTRLHRHRLLTLEEQFRMNEAICTLVSEVFYEGKLRPANQEVSERVFSDLLGGPLPRMEHPLLAEIWDPSRPVVFVDTSDDPDAQETYGVVFNQEEVKANRREAEIVAWLAKGLLGALPPASAEALAKNMGVTSPYRSQNNLIASNLAGLPGIRVDTVDRFQGSECDIMLVSLVDNNVGRALGRLYRDWRRVNVAISRARSKLIVIGSRANFTVQGPSQDDGEARSMYRRLFDVVDRLNHTGYALTIPSGRLP